MRGLYPERVKQKTSFLAVSGRYAVGGKFFCCTVGTVNGFVMTVYEWVVRFLPASTSKSDVTPISYSVPEIKVI
jgi:hypothetical protein